MKSQTMSQKPDLPMNVSYPCSGMTAVTAVTKDIDPHILIAAVVASPLSRISGEGVNKGTNLDSSKLLEAMVLSQAMRLEPYARFTKLLVH
jgi:hypothetical protein